MEKRYINNPPLKRTPSQKITIIPESGTNGGSKVEIDKLETLQIKSST